jgi:hypothetical protein
LLCLGLLVFAALAGHDGTAEVVEGSKKLIVVAEDLVVYLKGLNTMVQHGLAAVGKALTADEIESQNSQIVLIEENINLAKEKIEKADNYQKKYALYFFLFFAALLLLGLSSWALGCGCGSMTMAVPVGFCMLMLSWLLFALFYAVAVTLDDTCTELSRYYYGTSNKITELIKCPNPAEFLTNYQTAFNMLNGDLYVGYDLWHGIHGSNTKINPRTNATCASAVSSCEALSGWNTTLCEEACLGSNSSLTVASQFESNNRFRKYVYDLVAEPNCSTSTAQWPYLVTSACSPCTTSLDPPSNDQCFRKSFMVMADSMFAVSYISSCHYLSQVSFASAVASAGACHPLSSGFEWMFICCGLIGSVYWAGDH